MDFIYQIDFGQLLLTTTLALGVYFAVLLAVLIDLWSGIRRSRRLGIQLKSKGLRRSLRKFNDYVLFIIMASIVDMLLYAYTAHEVLGIRSVPWLTLLAGIIAIFIEIWSVYENTDKKRKKDIKQAVDNLAELIKTKGDASAVIRHLQERINSDEMDKNEPLTPDYPND